MREALQEQGSKQAQRIREWLDHFLLLLDQALRCMLQGEQVPTAEKMVSLFEPHTAIIRKGKPGKPTEFGREVWLDEVDGGIISRYEVLAGTPDETTQLLPSLDYHRQIFNHPPRLLTGDPGVHSSHNEHYATDHGVKHVVLPKPGAMSGK